MTEFGELDEHGRYTKTRTLSQAAMRRCPHFIMAPEHYREDESCRCDDPSHREMEEWGYHWRAPITIGGKRYPGGWRTPGEKE